jgi:hypothetical protein
MDEHDDIGQIYAQVTVCEIDIKRELYKRGYKQTKENADLVGYSRSVQKEWHENDVSAWCDVIECGIDEVQDKLEEDTI